jgi:hypothetical protein
VTIFAREITDNLTSLVKKIDETVGKNKDNQMASFVVLLSEDSDAESQKLQALAKTANVQHVPLTIFDGQAGPPSYKIAADADVTVLMWVNLEVKANHAFKRGELNASAIDTIVSDTSKILR